MSSGSRTHLRVVDTLPDRLTRSLARTESFVEALDGTITVGVPEVLREGAGDAVVWRVRYLSGRSVLAEWSRADQATAWASERVLAEVRIPILGPFPRRVYQERWYGGSIPDIPVGSVRAAAGTGVGVIEEIRSQCVAVGECVATDVQRARYGAFISCWAAVVEAARWRQALGAVADVLDKPIDYLTEFE